MVSQSATRGCAEPPKLLKEFLRRPCPASSPRYQAARVPRRSSSGLRSWGHRVYEQLPGGLISWAAARSTDDRAEGRITVQIFRCRLLPGHAQSVLGSLGSRWTHGRASAKVLVPHDRILTPSALPVHDPLASRWGSTATSRLNPRARPRLPTVVAAPIDPREDRPARRPKATFA